VIVKGASAKYKKWLDDLPAITISDEQEIEFGPSRE
jgi:hypothetical protein